VPHATPIAPVPFCATRAIGTVVLAFFITVVAVVAFIGFGGQASADEAPVDDLSIAADGSSDHLSIDEDGVSLGEDGVSVDDDGFLVDEAGDLIENDGGPVGEDDVVADAVASVVEEDDVVELDVVEEDAVVEEDDVVEVVVVDDNIVVDVVTVVDEDGLVVEADSEESYIVVMNDLPGSAMADDRRSTAARDRLAAKHSSSDDVVHDFGHAVNGFAAELEGEEVASLLDDPAVKYIELDSVVRKQQVEQIDPPWGLDRIDQRTPNLDGSYFQDADGAGVDVYIVDTGVRATHNDFGQRVVGGFTAINDGNGWDDCEGHGTHVAGTAGGSTYGVAKNANIYAVRVLGCDGTGFTSGIIAGLDWVIANADGPSVANLSVGTDASLALDEAIARAHDAGITVVVAAANQNRDACLVSPSRAPKAITVGATAPDDSRAFFSNWGTCVDLFAPGRTVTSGWWFGDDESHTIDGTSMAAPLVSGVAALYLSENPNATPDDVAAAIVALATPNVVSNARAGSPNLLLYSRLGDQPLAAEPINNITATVNVAENLAEGAGQAAALEIEFSHYPLTPVTVNWNVSGGTANPAADLTRTSGSMTLTASDLRVDLTQLLVADWVVDDAVSESDETLRLSYTVSGGAVGAGSNITLTIVDNDRVPQGRALVVDDFETDRGWTIDGVGSNASTGNFEVATMAASPALGGLTYQLGTAVSGTKALVTNGQAGSGTGSFDVDNGTTTAARTIQLPADATYIDVSNYFAHYSNSNVHDMLELRIDDDVILRHEAADSELRPAEWSKVRADISAYAGQTVVFSASVGDLDFGSLVEAAIDNITVWAGSPTFGCSANAGTLTWTDAGQALYWVYKSIDNGATFEWVGRTLGATTLDDPSPAVGTLYQVHYNGIPRIECSITAEPEPAPPFACFADAGTLTWTDAGQSLYWVYKSVDGATFTWMGRTLGATTIDDGNPAPGTVYQVHYNGIPRVDCTVTAEPPAAAVFACSVSNGTISWTDAGQSLYWVYRSTNGGATYSWLGRTFGATTLTDSNAPAGSLYQVHYDGLPRIDCT